MIFGYPLGIFICLTYLLYISGLYSSSLYPQTLYLGPGLISISSPSLYLLQGFFPLFAVLYPTRSYLIFLIYIWFSYTLGVRSIYLSFTYTLFPIPSFSSLPSFCTIYMNKIQSKPRRKFRSIHPILMNQSYGNHYAFN